MWLTKIALIACYYCCLTLNNNLGGAATATHAFLDNGLTIRTPPLNRQGYEILQHKNVTKYSLDDKLFLNEHPYEMRDILKQLAGTPNLPIRIETADGREMQIADFLNSHSHSRHEFRIKNDNGYMNIYEIGVVLNAKVVSYMMPTKIVINGVHYTIEQILAMYGAEFANRLHVAYEPTREVITYDGTPIDVGKLYELVFLSRPTDIFDFTSLIINNVNLPFNTLMHHLKFIPHVQIKVNDQQVMSAEKFLQTHGDQFSGRVQIMYKGKTLTLPEVATLLATYTMTNQLRTDTGRIDTLLALESLLKEPNIKILIPGPNDKMYTIPEFLRMGGAPNTVFQIFENDKLLDKYELAHLLNVKGEVVFNNMNLLENLTGVQIVYQGQVYAPNDFLTLMGGKTVPYRIMRNGRVLRMEEITKLMPTLKVVRVDKASIEKSHIVSSEVLSDIFPNLKIHGLEFTPQDVLQHLAKYPTENNNHLQISYGGKQYEPTYFLDQFGKDLPTDFTIIENDRVINPEELPKHVNFLNNPKFLDNHLIIPFTYEGTTYTPNVLLDYLIANQHLYPKLKILDTNGQLVDFITFKTRHPTGIPPFVLFNGNTTVNPKHLEEVIDMIPLGKFKMLPHTKGNEPITPIVSVSEYAISSTTTYRHDGPELEPTLRPELRSEDDYPEIATPFNPVHGTPTENIPNVNINGMTLTPIEIVKFLTNPDFKDYLIEYNGRFYTPKAFLDNFGPNLPTNFRILRNGHLVPINSLIEPLRTHLVRIHSITTTPTYDTTPRIIVGSGPSGPNYNGYRQSGPSVLNDSPFGNNNVQNLNVDGRTLTPIEIVRSLTNPDFPDYSIDYNGRSYKPQMFLDNFGGHLPQNFRILKNHKLVPMNALIEPLRTYQIKIHSITTTPVPNNDNIYFYSPDLLVKLKKLNNPNIKLYKGGKLYFPRDLPDNTDLSDMQIMFNGQILRPNEIEVFIKAIDVALEKIELYEKMCEDTNENLNIDGVTLTPNDVLKLMTNPDFNYILIEYNGKFYTPKAFLDNFGDNLPSNYRIYKNSKLVPMRALVEPLRTQLIKIHSTTIAPSGLEFGNGFPSGPTYSVFRPSGPSLRSDSHFGPDDSGSPSFDIESRSPDNTDDNGNFYLLHTESPYGPTTKSPFGNTQTLTIDGVPLTPLDILQLLTNPDFPDYLIGYNGKYYKPQMFLDNFGGHLPNNFKIYKNRRLVPMHALIEPLRTHLIKIHSITTTTPSYITTPRIPIVGLEFGNGFPSGPNYNGFRPHGPTMHGPTMHDSPFGNNNVQNLNIGGQILTPLEIVRLLTNPEFPNYLIQHNRKYYTPKMFLDNFGDNLPSNFRIYRNRRLVPMQALIEPLRTYLIKMHSVTTTTSSYESTPRIPVVGLEFDNGFTSGPNYNAFAPKGTVMRSDSPFGPDDSGSPSFHIESRSPDDSDDNGKLYFLHNESPYGPGNETPFDDFVEDLNIDGLILTPTDIVKLLANPEFPEYLIGYNGKYYKPTTFLDNYGDNLPRNFRIYKNRKLVPTQALIEPLRTYLINIHSTTTTTSSYVTTPRMPIVGLEFGNGFPSGPTYTRFRPNGPSMHNDSPFDNNVQNLNIDGRTLTPIEIVRLLTNPDFPDYSIDYNGRSYKPQMFLDNFGGHLPHNFRIVKNHKLVPMNELIEPLRTYQIKIHSVTTTPSSLEFDNGFPSGPNYNGFRPNGPSTLNDSPFGIKNLNIDGQIVTPIEIVRLLTNPDFPNYLIEYNRKYYKPKMFLDNFGDDLPNNFHVCKDGRVLPMHDLIEPLRVVLTRRQTPSPIYDTTPRIIVDRSIELQTSGPSTESPNYIGFGPIGRNLYRDTPFRPRSGSPVIQNLIIDGRTLNPTDIVKLLTNPEFPNHFIEYNGKYYKPKMFLDNFGDNLPNNYHIYKDGKEVPMHALIEPLRVVLTRIQNPSPTYGTTPRMIVEVNGVPSTESPNVNEFGPNVPSMYNDSPFSPGTKQPFGPGIGVLYSHVTTESPSFSPELRSPDMGFPYTPDNNLPNGPANGKLYVVRSPYGGTPFGVIQDINIDGVTLTPNDIVKTLAHPEFPGYLIAHSGKFYTPQQFIDRFGEHMPINCRIYKDGKLVLMPALVRPLRAYLHKIQYTTTARPIYATTPRMIIDSRFGPNGPGMYTDSPFSPGNGSPHYVQNLNIDGIILTPIDIVKLLTNPDFNDYLIDYNGRYYNPQMFLDNYGGHLPNNFAIRKNRRLLPMEELIEPLRSYLIKIHSITTTPTYNTTPRIIVDRLGYMPSNGLPSASNTESPNYNGFGLSRPPFSGHGRGRNGRTVYLPYYRSPPTGQDNGSPPDSGLYYQNESPNTGGNTLSLYQYQTVNKNLPYYVVHGEVYSPIDILLYLAVHNPAHIHISYRDSIYTPRQFIDQHPHEIPDTFQFVTNAGVLLDEATLIRNLAVYLPKKMKSYFPRIVINETILSHKEIIEALIRHNIQGLQIVHNGQVMSLEYFLNTELNFSSSDTFTFLLSGRNVNPKMIVHIIAQLYNQAK